MKIIAVVTTLLLAVSFAFAVHQDSGDTVSTSDRDCTDMNPYDSIDQCVGKETVSDRTLSTSDTWTSSSGIERTSDEWITLRCRPGDETDVWECTVIDDTEMTSDRTVNGFTTRSTTTARGTGWSDMYDYNNPDRVTTSGVDDDMTVEEDSETRGFESPVVYRNNLNTDRTSPEQAD